MLELTSIPPNIISHESNRVAFQSLIIEFFKKRLFEFMLDNFCLTLSATADAAILFPAAFQ
jgi:hypothetical protein